jgi:hypothetical protein
MALVGWGCSSTKSTPLHLDGGQHDTAIIGQFDGPPVQHDGPNTQTDTLLQTDTPLANTPDPGTGGICVADSDCTTSGQGCIAIFGDLATGLEDGGAHSFSGSCQTKTSAASPTCPETTDTCVTFTSGATDCYCLCTGNFSVTFANVPIYDSNATLPSSPWAGTVHATTTLCDQNVPALNGQAYGIHDSAPASGNPYTQMFFSAGGVNWVYAVIIDDSGWDTAAHDMGNSGDGFDLVELLKLGVSGTSITSQTIYGISSGGTMQLSTAPAHPTGSTAVNASGTVQGGELLLIEGELCGSHTSPCG